jgi:formylglycine-generating enzyme required for sulfatase activity
MKILVRTNEKDALKYVFIPPGEFQMGCVPGNVACPQDESHRHLVKLSHGFWLSQTEVTQSAFEKVTRRRPSCRFTGGDRPVENVTWYEATHYCAAAGGRLPTEAEWERAARGGVEGLRFPWGNEIARQNAQYAVSREEGTANVGSYSPNSFGLFDMAGNVWEWVADFYDKRYYAISPSSDPQGSKTGRYRVARGGSWFNGPDYLRVSHRLPVSPDKRTPDLGFRCILTDPAN